MKSRRSLIIKLSITLVAIFVCLGAVWAIVTWFSIGAISAFGENQCDPKTPANTEALGQFKFPPSMRNLTSSCFGLQGWGGFAEFEMSPSDLNYFVSHSKITPPLTRSGSLVSDDLATKASTMKTYLHGRYMTQTSSEHGLYSFSQEVLIDTSNPTVYSVYVSFSGG